MRLVNNKADYNEFRTFLEQACGILLGDNKEYLVESRIRPVVLRHDITGLGELVRQMKQAAGKGLKEEVIDAMTTNETLWFRDMHPYRILTDKIFPEFDAGNTLAPLKVWSAACSSGQEPYSISIMANEYAASQGKLKQGVRITATDISPTVLATAKAGVYEKLALARGMSEERQKQYFTPHGESAWKICSKIQSTVAFQSINLLESFSRIPERYDVIFCRNVLIYFSAALKLDILSRMHQKLKPGGYLILGSSESLNGLSDKYELIQCRPGIIYRAL